MIEEQLDENGNPIAQPEPEPEQPEEAQPEPVVPAGPLSFLEGLAALVHEHADMKTRLAQVEALAQSPDVQALAEQVEQLLSLKFRQLL